MEKLTKVLELHKIIKEFLKAIKGKILVAWELTLPLDLKVMN